MATANEKLRDFSIARQISLLRLSDTEAGQLLQILQGADAKVAQRLARVRSPSSLTAFRLRRLKKDLRSIVQVQMADIRGELRPYLRELAEIEIGSEVEAIGRTFTNVGVTLGVATPRIGATVAAIRSRPMMGRPLTRWADLMGQRDFDRVWATVLQGVTIGQTTEEISRAILGTAALGRTDGIREVTRRAARTMARTFTIHAATVARDQVWQDNADIIDKLEFVATLDGRTTAICQGLDGKLFEINIGPRPPLHMNCRSVMAPVLKKADDFLDDTTDEMRASMDGQVPANLSYGEWLKTRSKGFQDDVLGSTRGALFREGGLTVDKFVNFNTHEPFTLKELRRRQPAAFTEAGF